MPTENQYDDRLRPPYGEGTPEAVRCMANGTTGDYLDRYDWLPGNGTRYDLLYGSRDGSPETEDDTRRYYLAHLTYDPKHCMEFRDTYLHYTYVMDKLALNEADACGVLWFLERMGHAVGYPRPMAVGG